MSRPVTSMYLGRVLRRITAAVVVLGVVQVGAAGAASAHTTLVASAPADAEQLVTSPAAVTLTFNEAVSTDFSQVSVTGPDGATWAVETPVVSGAVVTQPLAGQGPAGTYEVAWRVVADDGHPVTGAFSYVVTDGPTTSAPPPTAPTTSAPGTPATQPATPATQQAPPVGRPTVPAAAVSGDDGANWLPIVAILLVLVVALGVAARVVSRRRSSAGGGG